MRKLTKLTLAILLAAISSATHAADPQTRAGDQQVIELKDGGKIVIAADKSMAHYDAAGKRVRMRDSKIMEAKDGSKLMMKNNAIWKTLTEKGTLNPNR